MQRSYFELKTHTHTKMKSCIEINICERQAKMERILMKSFDFLEPALPEDSFPGILSVNSFDFS